LTLLIALIVSWVSLRYRYLEKGRPFGSPSAAVRAVTVIVLTAVLGTVLGLLLPRLPVTIGAVIPALLCADRLDRLGKAETGLNAVENPQWFGIVTLGVSLLLRWLETQMAADCEKWCKLKMSEVHDLDEIEQAAESLRATVTRASTNAHLEQKLQSDYDAICSAVSLARYARDHGQHEEVRKQSFAAEQALIVMLGRAYKSGFTSTAVMPSSPDQQPEHQRRQMRDRGTADLSGGFKAGRKPGVAAEDAAEGVEFDSISRGGNV
jgi:hypothetical protein